MKNMDRQCYDCKFYNDTPQGYWGAKWCMHVDAIMNKVDVLDGDLPMRMHCMTMRLPTMNCGPSGILWEEQNAKSDD